MVMFHYNQKYESVPTTPAGTARTWSPTSKRRTSSLAKRRTALIGCAVLFFFVIYNMLFSRAGHRVRPHSQYCRISAMLSLYRHADQTISLTQSHTMLLSLPMPLSSLPNRYHIATPTRSTPFHPTSTAIPAISHHWTSMRHLRHYAMTGNPW